MVPPKLHDGDLFDVSGGTGSPIYAEYLNTNGRQGLRITDSLGRGVLIDDVKIENLHQILGRMIAP